MLFPQAVAVLILMAGVSYSQETDCSYSALLDHLKSNLTNKSDVRPVTNWTTPTLVRVDFMMNGILEANAKSQTLTCNTRIMMVWTNEFLTWNPNEFCGIDRLTVPRDKLWIPDIVILEDVSGSEGTIQGPYVTLYHNGTVKATESRRLTTMCELDLMDFPFDTQNCPITFMSMIHSDQSIMFSYGSAHIQTSEKHMLTEGEWTLKEITINDTTFETDHESLIYEITMTRRHGLYVVNFIMPFLYFWLLDILATILISEAKGEKLGVKVTLLLSISVLLLILQDMLPSTTEKLPHIVEYSLYIFILMTMSLMETMIVSRLKDMDGYVSQDALNSTNTSEETLQETDPQNVADGVSDEERTVNERFNLEKLKNCFCASWTTLARYIDFVYFAAYFIMIAALLVYAHVTWFKLAYK